MADNQGFQADPNLPEGANELNKLRFYGFKDDEIKSEKARLSEEMSKANFSRKEIMDYFGDKEPDTSATKALAQQQVAQQLKPKQPHETIDASPKPVPSEGLMDSFWSGWGNSFLGMSTRGQLSPIYVPKEASELDHLAAQGGKILGDLFPMMAGAMMGSELGPLGADAGAQALPAALNKIIADHLEKGDIKDRGELARRTAETLWEGAKGAIMGYTAGFVGGNARVVNALTESATLKAATSLPGRLLLEDAAVTSISAFLEQRMPEWSDFVHNGVSIAGLHAVGAVSDRVLGGTVAGKMVNVYRKTGKTPEAIAEAAQADPVLKQELLSKNPDLPIEAAPEYSQGSLAHQRFTKETQAKAQEYYSSDQAKADYDAHPDTMGGKRIDPDIARTIYPGFKENPTAHVEVLHEAVSQFAKDRFAEKLAEPGNADVVFTGGGPSSGKSSLMGIPEIKSEINDSLVVYDSTMSNYESASKRINQAIDSGHPASIRFVYTDLDTAIARAKSRFQAEGRHVPADYFGEAHYNSIETIIKLAEEFKDNDMVDIKVYDNSVAGKPPKEVPLEKLADLRYTEGVDAVRERAQEGLKDVTEEAQRRTEAAVKAHDLSRGAQSFQREVRADEQGDSQPQAGLAQGDQNTLGQSEPPPPARPQDPDGGSSEPPVPERLPRKSLAQTKEVREAGDHLLSRIGEEAKPKKPSPIEAAAAAFDKTYINKLDFHAAIKSSLEEIGRDPKLGENGYALSRLGVTAKTKARVYLESGTFDKPFNGKVNGESYFKVLSDFKSKFGDLDEFRKYMLGKRAIELDKRGIAKGFDIDKANTFVKANPEMNELNQRRVAFRNRMVDWYAQTGMISAEMAEKWKAKGNEYAAMQTIMEPDEKTGGYSTGDGFMKKIEGSMRKVKDPIAQDIKDTHAMVQMGYHNMAKQAFVDDHLAYQAETPDAPVRVKLAENQTGVPNKDSQIALWRNGKREIYDVPKGLAEPLEALSTSKPALDSWLGLLRGYAAVERSLTVGNPFFAPIHALRQQFVAPGLSKTNLIPFVHSLYYLPKYALGSLRNSAEYVDFIESGAAKDHVLPTQHWLDGTLEELESTSPVLDKTWNKIKSLGGLSHMMITLHDNSLGFAEYTRLRNRGASRTEAALGARDVLPDIQKTGLQQSAFFATTPFSKVGFQGQARMVEALKDDPYAYVAKNLAYITVPSLLLAAVNHGDDAYDKLPGYQKAHFWNFHMSEWRNANSLAEYNSVHDAVPSNARIMEDGTMQINDGPFLRIQKPFTTGIIFGSMIESMVDGFFKAKPHAFQEFAKSVTGSLMEMPIPAFLRTPVETMTNYNFFTGQPIVSQSMEDKVPEVVYDQYTSETAKKISQAMMSYVPFIGELNDKGGAKPGLSLASPLMIENALHNLGSGSYIIEAILDESYRKAGVAKPDIGQEKKWYELPGPRQFFSRYPTLRSEDVVLAEERMAKANSVMKSVRDRKSLGDEYLMTDLEDKYGMYMEKVAPMAKQFSIMRRNIVEINEDPSMSPTEKRQLIDTTVYDLMSFAQEVNKTMDDFEDDYKKYKEEEEKLRKEAGGN